MEKIKKDHTIAHVFTSQDKNNIKGYTILSEIGEGGYGSVFKAKQQSTGQVVALKVLRLENDLNEIQKENKIKRFDREAELCGTLHHPNIVKLIDRGVSGDIIYIVYEYVPGENLKDYIHQNGALSATECGALMGQVLDALVCAHSNGIVHRDLKPQNIMVTKTGSQINGKILDFGIGAITTNARKNNYQSLTLTKETVGTP